MLRPLWGDACWAVARGVGVLDAWGVVRLCEDAEYVCSCLKVGWMVERWDPLNRGWQTEDKAVLEVPAEADWESSGDDDDDATYVALLGLWLC